MAPGILVAGLGWFSPCAAVCVGGVTAGSAPLTLRGLSPRSIRSRTSLAVAGDIRATLAACRSDAVGCAARNSAARILPSLWSRGRVLPSLPTLASTSGTWSADRLISETVFGDNPVERAMARSDSSGQDCIIRVAAARRSCRESGRPCEIFSSTARRKISASEPVKNMTSISSCPRSDAACRRCMPSITRIVLWSTRIGGSGASSSASRATWALSSPFRRGEFPGLSESTGTRTVSPSI